MFTGGMSEETINRMQSCCVQVYPIPDDLLGGSIINTRWKIYADFLNEHKGEYDLVFTADLRDVIFQADVFKFLDSSSSFLGLAIEDGILTESVNQRWIVNAYGRELYETIKDNRIICVGTIWGTPDKFTEFSEVMWEKLGSEWSTSRKVIEQAVGNYLIYHDKMFADELQLSTNYDGAIMTIALTHVQDIHIDSAGNVLNGTGEVAAVVHQYDRKPELVNIVLKKYGFGMSVFAKLTMKHYYDLLGRVMRFMRKIRRKGFVCAVSEAINRRIHK